MGWRDNDGEGEGMLRVTLLLLGRLPRNRGEDVWEVAMFEGYVDCGLRLLV